MTTLQINELEYDCPSDWSELKWSQFFELKNYAELVENKPVSADTQIENNSNRHAPNENDLLNIFCKIDPDTSVLIDPLDRKRFVSCLIQRFIDPLFFRTATVDHERDTGIKAIENVSKWAEHKFLANDERLCFPEYEVDYDENIVPLCNLSAVQWCEATDLYLADKWKFAPVIAALLCSGDEKVYDEDRVKRRVEPLKQLDMECVLALLGALNDAHRKMKELYPACYVGKSGLSAASKNTEKSSWNELLLWTGHFRADEIERLRLLNCYDFMALVNARIRAGG